MQSSTQGKPDALEGKIQGSHQVEEILVGSERLFKPSGITAKTGGLLI